MIYIQKLFCLCFICVYLLSVSVFAAPDCYGDFEIPVDVRINGSIIRCPNKAFVQQGTTYIPLRAFSDALSAPILWDDATQSATVTVNGKTFVFYAKQNFCTVNGTEYTEGAANMYCDSMFVPVKFICTQLDFSVSWDGFYYIADITAPGITVPESVKDSAYTEEDMLWLAKIVQVESGGEGIATRIGVANTVVNRVRSPLYPNTVKGAILDTNYGVQYPPAHTAKMDATPSAASMIAAKCALNGVELVGNSVSFVNINLLASSWVANNMQYYTTIGNLAFFEN